MDIMGNIDLILCLENQSAKKLLEGGGGCQISLTGSKFKTIDLARELVKTESI